MIRRQLAVMDDQLSLYVDSLNDLVGNVNDACQSAIDVCTQLSTQFGHLNSQTAAKFDAAIAALQAAQLSLSASMASAQQALTNSQTVLSQYQVGSAAQNAHINDISANLGGAIGHPRVPSGSTWRIMAPSVTGRPMTRCRFRRLSMQLGHQESWSSPRACTGLPPLSSFLPMWSWNETGWRITDNVKERRERTYAVMKGWLRARRKEPELDSALFVLQWHYAGKEGYEWQMQRNAGNYEPSRHCRRHQRARNRVWWTNFGNFGRNGINFGSQTGANADRHRCNRRREFYCSFALHDSFCVESYVTGVGTHSIEVFAKVVGEHLLTGERFLGMTAFFTFVILDKSVEPEPIIPKATRKKCFAKDMSSAENAKRPL